MKESFKLGCLNGQVQVSAGADYPYIVYSATPVTERFKGVDECNPSNLIAVRLEQGQLQYSSKSGWEPFEQEQDDRILAVGLADAGIVMDFEGQAAFVNGLRLGYCKGDLKFGTFDKGKMVVRCGTTFEGIADQDPDD